MSSTTRSKQALRQDLEALRQKVRAVEAELAKQEAAEASNGRQPVHSLEAPEPPQRASAYDTMFADVAREAQEKLRESEERQRIAVMAAGLGVFEWDVLADRAIWENDRMYELVGHTRADGTVNREAFLSRYVHPEDAERFQRELNGAAEKREAFRVACRVRRKTDGEYRWLEFAGDFEVRAGRLANAAHRRGGRHYRTASGRRGAARK